MATIPAIMQPRSRKAFDALVRTAVAALPARFRQHLDTVAFVVMERPDRRFLDEMGLPPDEANDLLGFYDGVALTDQSHLDADAVPVGDTIYIFQRPLEEICATEDELIEEIRITVVHEVGHHFGLDDDEIENLGYG